jgi:hypothetical protein
MLTRFSKPSIYYMNRCYAVQPISQSNRVSTLLSFKKRFYDQRTKPADNHPNEVIDEYAENDVCLDETVFVNFSASTTNTTPEKR